MVNITKTIGIQPGSTGSMGTSWDSLLFAKVVFLDLSNPDAKPRLFQLKDSALSDTPPDLLKSSAFSFNHEAFVLLGYASKIDRDKKIIELSNNNSVSYTHLVAVSGANIETAYHDAEFSAGLHLLVEALRLKEIMPSPGKLNKSNKKRPNTPKHTQEPSNPEVEKLVHPFILNAGEQAIASSILSLNKRLYSLQV